MCMLARVLRYFPHLNFYDSSVDQVGPGSAVNTGCVAHAQVGTVFASSKYVAPMAVGVDIGEPSDIIENGFC
jgi:hypothetical protein